MIDITDHAAVRAEAERRTKVRATGKLVIGDPAPDPAPITEREANVLEKQEQHEVTKLFRAFGLRVYSTSQARAAKVTPGLPDLWCMHERLPIAFWWETKRQVGGHFRPAQIEFREFAQRCGVGYGAGDRHDAAAYLIARGLAYRSALATLEPTQLLIDSRL